MKNTKLTKYKTLQAACCIKDKRFLFASLSDSLINTDYELSYIFSYDAGSIDKTPWRWNDYDWKVVSVCYESNTELRCVLSREGQVNIYGPGDDRDHNFQIPEAGVFGNAADLGYVNRIQVVGTKLYVCGMNRQVYRFDWNGKDLAKGQWSDIAGAMRQSHFAEPPDDDGEAFDQWLDDSDSIDFVDIAGSSENDIYAVGDQTWHYDGQQWIQLAMPSEESLAAIKVLDEKRVVMVGHNGSLMIGNAQNGFTDYSSIDNNQNFIGVEWYKDKLFLASNLGLFTYDLTEKKIKRCATNLNPDLQDAHMLEAKDGILWSFGFKDIAFFDGKEWTRVDHPDNIPIR
jgi:hypothetical protein